MTDYGNVRVLPGNTPNVPPRALLPNAPLPYPRTWCGAEIPPELVPIEHDHDTTGYFCTRQPHGDDEAHVCHYYYREDQDCRQPAHVIVWGGE